MFIERYGFEGTKCKRRAIDDPVEYINWLITVASGYVDEDGYTLLGYIQDKFDQVNKLALETGGWVIFLFFQPPGTPAAAAANQHSILELLSGETTPPPQPTTK